MQEVILIRHAETYYNCNQTDDLDSDLTGRGYQQADALADYLKKSGDAEGFTGFVSPFKRCLVTAQAIHKAIGLPFTVYPLVHEYGATWNKIPFDVLVPERKWLFPSYDWGNYPKEGLRFTAETYHQFLDRLHQVRGNKLPDKTLVISHAAVVYTLADLYTGGGVIEDGYGQVTNASITKLRGVNPDYVFKNEWKGE